MTVPDEIKELYKKKDEKDEEYASLKKSMVKAAYFTFAGNTEKGNQHKSEATTKLRELEIIAKDQEFDPEVAIETATRPQQYPEVIDNYQFDECCVFCQRFSDGNTAQFIASPKKSRAKELTQKLMSEFKDIYSAGASGYLSQNTF